MALGLSLSLDNIPGVSSLLGKVNSVKADFLAVPARANAALDKLVLVQQAMAQNNAPPSALSDALTTKQHIQQVQSEWNASAADFGKLQSAGNGISLDTVTTAGNLLTSATYVLSSMNSLESSVNALAAKYLTAAQQKAVNAQAGGSGSNNTLLLVGGAAALLLLMRKR